MEAYQPTKMYYRTFNQLALPPLAATSDVLLQHPPKLAVAARHGAAQLQGVPTSTGKTCDVAGPRVCPSHYLARHTHLNK